MARLLLAGRGEKGGLEPEIPTGNEVMLNEQLGKLSLISHSSRVTPRTLLLRHTLPLRALQMFLSRLTQRLFVQHPALPNTGAVRGSNLPSQSVSLGAVALGALWGT